jgi:hypothetical protein
MSVGILLVQAAVFAVLSAVIASEKNRSPVKWGIVGALFSLVGLIVTLALSEGEPDSQTSGAGQKRGQPASEKEFDPDEHEKKCPTCAEYIKLEARACRYCGHEYSDEKVAEQVAQAREDFHQKRRSAKQDEAQDEVQTNRGEASNREVLGIVGIVVLVGGGIILLASLAAG